jgi:hypothetical protein
MRRDCECYAIIGAHRVCKAECPVWLVQLPFGELWYICTIHLETLSKYYRGVKMVVACNPSGILPAEKRG